MSYPSDLTEDEWALLEPVFNAPSKRGRKHADDLRTVVGAMLYIGQAGCQWRDLPQSFGPWTRVWSQFRRWSRNKTWAQALTVLHAAAREADGRAETTPSMVVIDTHLAQDRLQLVLVDRGGTAAAARALGRGHDVEVRRVGWDDKQPVFRTIRHAWRVEVAHGRLGRSRRLAKSFENTTASARLAPGCLHRHHASPAVPRAGPATPSPTCRLTGHTYAKRAECGMSGRSMTGGVPPPAPFSLRDPGACPGRRVGVATRATGQVSGR
jgi:putative transposase